MKRRADMTITISVRQDNRPHLDLTFFPEQDAFHVVVYDWRGLPRAAENIPASRVLEDLHIAAKTAAAREASA